MLGIEIWNNEQGYCLPSFPELKTGDIALAIEPNAECDEWTVDEIALRLGYSPESRYFGENQPDNPLLTEIYQFIGVYSNRGECQMAAQELIAGGIPESLIRFFESNQSAQGIDFKRSSTSALTHS